MEHEAEKYQQRLQAIAEKRRLQEEQERARREMEDEKLRLQQLKRKSLRDQWLMDGPPTSPDSTSPRSPLWGSKAQDIETRINKLQVTSEQLAEEEVKVKKHIEDGFDLPSSDTQTNSKEQREAEPVETVVTEMVPNGPIVENGKDETKDVSVHTENHDSEVEAVADAEEEATEMSTTAAVVNGAVDAETSTKTPEQDEAPHTNGSQIHPVDILGAGGVTMTFLGFKEAEPGHGVNEDEDNDACAVIRAERVIITDEGEEIQEEDAGSAQESDGNNEESESATVVVDEIENQIDPEISVDKEQDEVTKGPQSEDFSAEPVVTVEEEEETVEQELPEIETLEAPVQVSQAPVLSTTQPSPTTRSKTEGMTTESRPPKEEEEEVVATTRISLSEFQEVPLDGESPENKAKSEKPPAEQEPLIAKAEAQMDTSSPNRAEDAGAPKRKTCQCCSIM
nr:paralemmin-3 [Misgurnus anguillicaudatus]XP_055068694.1 paralemmin-3 [Misgurnus anguillicaudatus]XP_055068695.1 paralemmin-3 [Misgurnus anguillicaudatus]